LQTEFFTKPINLHIIASLKIGDAEDFSMTRIRCRERHCTFNRSGICTSVEIEYEPDAGCLTMETREDAEDDEEEFEDEELEELDEDLEDEEEDDDSEDWDEDEEYVGKKNKRR
jgi:hypothetical protein